MSLRKAAASKRSGKPHRRRRRKEPRAKVLRRLVSLQQLALKSLTDSLQDLDDMEAESIRERSNQKVLLQLHAYMVAHDALDLHAINALISCGLTTLSLAHLPSSHNPDPDTFSVVANPTFGHLTELDISAPNMHWSNDHLTKLKPLKHLDTLRANNCLLDPGFLDILPVCLLHLHLSRVQTVNTAELVALKSFRRLQTLNISNCLQVDNGTLDQLAPAFRTLTDLDLSWCVRVTDAAIDNLTRLTTLRSLNVESTGLSSESTQALCSLPSLRSLNLSMINNHPSSNPFQHIASLTGLRSLDLKHCRVTDSCAGSALNTLTSLQTLHLNDNRITPAIKTQVDWSVFGASLHTLHLAGNPLVGSDENSLAFLAWLENLTDLDLSDCGLHDTSTPHISALTSLRTLSLQHNEFTDDSVKLLSSSPVCYSVHHLRVNVGDRGVAALHEWSLLRRLHIQPHPVEHKDQITTLKALVRIPCLSHITLESVQLDAAIASELAPLPHLQSLMLLRCTVDNDTSGDIDLTDTTGPLQLFKSIPGFENVKLDQQNTKPKFSYKMKAAVKNIKAALAFQGSSSSNLNVPGSSGRKSRGQRRMSTGLLKVNMDGSLETSPTASPTSSAHASPTRLSAVSPTSSGLRPRSNSRDKSPLAGRTLGQPRGRSRRRSISNFDQTTTRSILELMNATGINTEDAHVEDNAIMVSVSTEVDSPTLSGSPRLRRRGSDSRRRSSSIGLDAIRELERELAGEEQNESTTEAEDAQEALEKDDVLEPLPNQDSQGMTEDREFADSVRQEMRPVRERFRVGSTDLFETVVPMGISPSNSPWKDLETSIEDHIVVAVSSPPATPRGERSREDGDDGKEESDASELTLEQASEGSIKESDKRKRGKRGKSARRSRSRMSSSRGSSRNSSTPTSGRRSQGGSKRRLRMNSNLSALSAPTASSRARSKTMGGRTPMPIEEEEAAEAADDERRAQAPVRTRSGKVPAARDLALNRVKQGSALDRRRIQSMGNMSSIARKARTVKIAEDSIAEEGEDEGESKAQDDPSEKKKKEEEDKAEVEQKKKSVKEVRVVHTTLAQQRGSESPVRKPVTTTTPGSRFASLLAEKERENERQRMAEEQRQQALRKARERAMEEQRRMEREQEEEEERKRAEEAAQKEKEEKEKEKLQKKRLRRNRSGTRSKSTMSVGLGRRVLSRNKSGRMTSTPTPEQKRGTSGDAEDEKTSATAAQVKAMENKLARTYSGGLMEAKQNIALRMNTRSLRNENATRSASTGLLKLGNLGSGMQSRAASPLRTGSPAGSHRRLSNHHSSDDVRIARSPMSVRAAGGVFDRSESLPSDGSRGAGGLIDQADVEHGEELLHAASTKSESSDGDGKKREDLSSTPDSHVQSETSPKRLLRSDSGTGPMLVRLPRVRMPSMDEDRMSTQSDDTVVTTVHMSSDGEDDGDELRSNDSPASVIIRDDSVQDRPEADIVHVPTTLPDANEEPEKQERETSMDNDGDGAEKQAQEDNNESEEPSQSVQKVANGEAASIEEANANDDTKETPPATADKEAQEQRPGAPTTQEGSTDDIDNSAEQKEATSTQKSREKPVLSVDVQVTKQPTVPHSPPKGTPNRSPRAARAVPKRRIKSKGLLLATPEGRSIRVRTKTPPEKMFASVSPKSEKRDVFLKSLDELDMEEKEERAKQALLEQDMQVSQRQQEMREQIAQQDERALQQRRMELSLKQADVESHMHVEAKTDVHQTQQTVGRGDGQEEREAQMQPTIAVSVSVRGKKAPMAQSGGGSGSGGSSSSASAQKHLDEQHKYRRVMLPAQRGLTFLQQPPPLKDDMEAMGVSSQVLALLDKLKEPVRPPRSLEKMKKMQRATTEAMNRSMGAKGNDTSPEIDWEALQAKRAAKTTGRRLAL